MGHRLQIVERTIEDGALSAIAAVVEHDHKGGNGIAGQGCQFVGAHQQGAVAEEHHGRVLRAGPPGPHGGGQGEAEGGPEAAGEEMAVLAEAQIGGAKEGIAGIRQHSGIGGQNGFNRRHQPLHPHRLVGRRREGGGRRGVTSRHRQGGGLRPARLRPDAQQGEGIKILVALLGRAQPPLQIHLQHVGGVQRHGEDAGVEVIEGLAEHQQAVAALHPFANRGLPHRPLINAERLGMALAQEALAREAGGQVPALPLQNLPQQGLQTEAGQLHASQHQGALAAAHPGQPALPLAPQPLRDGQGRGGGRG